MSNPNIQENRARQLLGLAVATAMLTSLFGVTGYSANRSRSTAAGSTAAFGQPGSGAGSTSVASVQASPQSLNRWTSNGPDGGWVSSLAIDPANPATIYAGTGTGVFKSNNGGGTWNSSLARNYVSALAIDPKTPTTIYAASDDGVSKSTDGGASWSVIGPVQHVNALGIHPTNPNTIYAASIFDGVFKSIDGGGTWINSGLSKAQPSELAIDPVNPNIVYVAGKSGPPGYFAIVFKSIDGGQSWSSSTPNPSSGQVIALAIDPTNPNIIYTGVSRGGGGSGGVYKSSDGAKTWSAFNNGITSSSEGIGVLAIDPGNPNIIYAGGNGVFKTTNGAVSWSEIDSDINNPNTGALVINPLNTNITYAGTAGGLFKSTTGGASWSAANIGLRSTYVQTMSVDPGNANTIYAGTGGSGLFKSNDNGGSWRRLESGLTSRDIYALAIDPHNPATIYAGADRLYKSTNGGESWSAGLGIGDVTALAIDPGDTNLIYAATANGAFKSANGGGSWTAAGNLSFYFNYPTSLVIDPSNSKTIYAAAIYYCDFSDICKSTVFKSTDGGASWNRSDTGFSSSDVFALVIDPTNAATLYVSVYSEGAAGYRLYKSTDSGGTWSAIGTGLPNNGVSSLVVNPASPNLIYAGSNGNGVFKSADGGASWNPLNDGLANLNINKLAIDASGNFLHAGTYGSVFDYQFGATPNQIDDAQFFIRQHYRDFLNRTADPDGLAFWTNEITSCGVDPQCVELKRINDSASFFLSIEFQETGYLVYRFYKTSYGNLPNAPVPITLNEFLPDTQEIGQDVIVRQGGWEQKLESNKQAFAAEFVQRPRFVSTYPTSFSSEQFVDALFANAGVTPSASDHSAAINEFSFAASTADTAARARVLRRVAESSTLARQEFNRAFVLMQYFGYLRRNPNDSPDGNFAGYDFWLNKLNSFNGDFIQAEMVKAFIESSEYRRRFGQ